MDTTQVIMQGVMLAGGLALFLYGMDVMSSGLEKIAGGKLESILKMMTSNKLVAFILGLVVTCVIQSSSAVTVMLVGLVNSGIMQLGQTIGVIMGSNVGTTITAWILSLSGLEGDGLLVSMLKPKNFSMIVALIGIILIMFTKSGKKKDIGTVCVGFAVLMQGMEFMSSAVSDLKNEPWFSDLFVAFDNPVFGVIIGTVLTGIIQSSSASVGILQAISLTGCLTYGMSLPIIMGQNIGTCMTALLSCIGAKSDARRVAVAHVIIKIIGVLVFLPVVVLLESLGLMGFMENTVDPVGIAIMHTIFNLLNTFVLLPFSKQIVKLACFFVKNKDGEGTGEAVSGIIVLDENLLKTPSVAVEVCRNSAIEMAELTRTTIKDALFLLKEGYDKELDRKVVDNETALDNYEDKLNGYLVKISKESITGADSRKVSKMMHIVGNLERISDHAVNLAESAKEMAEKGISFSPDGKNEVAVITEAIAENIDKALDAYIHDDLALAHKIEPLEEVVDNISKALKSRHIHRLQNDECTVELGYIFQDVLTNLERISDHCSNIAGCMIEVDEKENIHEYLHNIKANDEKFQEEYRRFSEVYFTKLGITDTELS